MQKQPLCNASRIIIIVAVVTMLPVGLGQGRASAETAAAAPRAYHEAPELAQLVAQGQLPPVNERLPENPKVLPVYEQIGQYGGTWRRAYIGMADKWGLTKIIEERIVEFYLADADHLTIEPNWADTVAVSPDAATYTFHIRKGLKWSDGVPVTTADVRFWYEDVFLNAEILPTQPAHLVINDQPLALDILDDDTFTVRFAASYPFFLEILAKLSTLDTRVNLDAPSFLLPAHYLKQFHPKYAAPDALAAIIAANGVTKWTDLWGADGPIASWLLNPDLPVINAWKIKTPPPAEQVVMTRNPYYFAVDPAGNQLPYIDEIVHTLKDPNDLALMAVAGELDMQDRHIRRADYTLLKNNESQGEYRVMRWPEAGAALFLNLNAANASLAALFNDARFRHALSIALNRQEIQETAFNGMGDIMQASPIRSSPYFDAEFAAKWIEYDPDAANALLDEIGLTQRDAAGRRLDADGQPVQFTVTYPSYLYGELIAKLIQGYWEDVGVTTTWDFVERAVFETRVKENQVEGTLYMSGRYLNIASDPAFFLGTVDDGTFAPRFGQWYDREPNGLEPPADHPLRQVWALWEQAKSAPTRAAADALLQQMITIHKDNVWVIGLVSPLPAPVIVRNNFRNVPTFGMALDEVRGTGIAQPAQFFFMQP